MSASRQPQITEELLSAYLDDQVTAEERILVEEAIANDPAISWQVDSLRQTIHLLQELPPLTLPRSFSLEAILAEARAMETSVPRQTEAVSPKTSAPQRTVVRKPVVEEPQDNWLQWFLRLWQGGNLQLRNAAAVAMTLFFVLFAGDRLLVSTRLPVTVGPTVLTSDAPVATEAPAAPVAEPTPTSAPTAVAANQATDSQEQAADGAVGNGAAANTQDNTPAQPETSAFRVQGATSAPPGDRPGPVEAPLTGEEGSNRGSGDPNADAPTASYNSENTERDGQAKSTASMSEATTDTMTQESVVVAESPVTTTALAALMSETVTTTDVISETMAVTTAVMITPTVAPTATVDSAVRVTVETSPTAAGVAWLTWAQMITAVSTAVFAGLWWRSRR